MHPQISLKKIDNRLIFLFFIFIIITAGLNSKLVSIQAIKAHEYNKIGKDQRLNKIEIPAIRGKILDADNFELASSISVKSVIANPYLISKPKKVANILADILGVSREKIYKKINQEKGFVYIARKIPVDKAALIEKQKINGIETREEVKRIYHDGTVGAHLLGFTRFDDNKGLGGLEYKYDMVLSGKPGALLVERDPFARIIPGGISKEIPAVHGNNIKLSIDKTIQYAVQKSLDNAIKKYKARSGNVVVMNATNGNIYAIANSPSFDPNLPRKNADLLRNIAITDVYEPGSTFKTIIAAGAIEDNKVNPKQNFYLPPTIRIGNKSIKEAHRSRAENMTFSEIIAKSSNVGAINLALKLGKDSLYGWVKKFGLINKTGIDLPSEQSGFLPDPDNWSSTTIGTVPIGQGVSVTRIQLLRAITAIGNGGFLLNPKVVLEIDGKAVYNKGGNKKRIISKRTSDILSEMLKKVVVDGTGALAKVQGYSTAGKTGTAQKPIIGGRGYEKGKYIASFVGFIPADKPKVGIIVTIEDPTPIWGGIVAAPVFSEVGKASMMNLGVPPDEKN